MTPNNAVCFKYECFSREFLIASIQTSIFNAVSNWTNMKKKEPLALVDLKKRPVLLIFYPYTSFSAISEDSYDKLIAAITNASDELNKYMQYYVRLNRYSFILCNKTISLDDDPVNSIEHLDKNPYFRLFSGTAAKKIKLTLTRPQVFINPSIVIFSLGFSYRFQREFVIEINDSSLNVYTDYALDLVKKHVSIEVFLKLSEEDTLHTFREDQTGFIVKRKSYVTNFTFNDAPTIEAFSLTLSKLENHIHNSQHFYVGDRVEAKAADGSLNPFFPGEISAVHHVDAYYKYTVMFDDGDQKTISQFSIIHG